MMIDWEIKQHSIRDTADQINILLILMKFQFYSLNLYGCHLSEFVIVQLAICSLMLGNH